MKIANTTNNNVAKDLATNVAVEEIDDDLDLEMEEEEEIEFSESQKEFLRKVAHNPFSSEGKTAKRCNYLKKTLKEMHAEAPVFLTEQPEDKEEIEMSGTQLLGICLANDTLNKRRRALQRAGLDATTTYNKMKQINDIEKVIRESVELIAKGKYATKAEIEMMIAKIEAAETGICYEQHSEAVDNAIVSSIGNTITGNLSNRAFTFESALNEAKKANFAI